MQRQRRLCRGQQSIATLFRATARMGTDAGKVNIQLGGSQEAVAAAHHFTCRHAGTDVNRSEALNVIDHARGDHRFRAAHTLFGGLEDQFNRTAELIFHRHQHCGEAQANGGMAVVPAGMHHARVTGSKSFTLRQMIGGLAFVEIQCIHIDAEAHHRAGTAGIECCHDAAESAREVADPLRQCALLQRTGFLLLQHGVVGQAHPRIGIDHFTAQLQLITEPMQFFSH